MVLLSRELSIVFIVFTVTCSHLWWGGEERQWPDPVPQLPWWLQAQQSVCVEDYCSSGLPCRPYLPVFWGKMPVIHLLNQIVFIFGDFYDWFGDSAHVRPTSNPLTFLRLRDMTAVPMITWRCVTETLKTVPCWAASVATTSQMTSKPAPTSCGWNLFQMALSTRPALLPTSSKVRG